MGLWTDSSSQEESDLLLIPFSLTLGLGTFWEAYGSFPNLLFNGDEALSDKGFATLGMKLRFVGKRSSAFKIALDGQVQNTINDLDPDLDGLTNYQYRLISSYRFKRLGLHLSGGYLDNEQPVSSSANVSYDSQTIYSGGIEFYPSERLRLIAEIEDYSAKIPGTEGRQEASVGFQYYLSPHLTLNSSLGFGMTDGSPDWRAIVGFSSCQGIGTYQVPIKRAVEKVIEVSEPEPVKVSKFKALTPLVPKVRPISATPVTSLEVMEAEEKKRAVLVKPSDRLSIPGSSLTRAQAVSSISPATSAEGLSKAAAVVSEPTVASLYKKFRFPDFAFSYDLSELSDEGKKELARVAEWLRKDNKWFAMKVVGHTDSVGSASYNEKLSLGRAVQVASYLVLNEGIDPARLFVQGAGESEPMGSNANPEGRKKNRRVELLVLVPEGDAFVPKAVSFNNMKTTSKVAIASDIPMLQEGKVSLKPARNGAAGNPGAASAIRETVVTQEASPIVPLGAPIAAPVVSVSSLLPVSVAVPVAAPASVAKVGAEILRSFSFPAVSFSYDLKALPGSLDSELSAVAAWLERNAGQWSRIRVVGHTDSVGAAAYNRALSVERASGVADHLSQQQGLNPELIDVVGAGESDPLENNLKASGRERNRRVEIEVIRKEDASSTRLNIPVPAPTVIEAVSPKAVASPEPAVRFVKASKGASSDSLLLELSSAEGTTKGKPSTIEFRVTKKAVLTEVFEKFVTPAGSFPYNESHYTEIGKDSFAEILEALKRGDEDLMVMVSGHTDAIGPQEFNRSLSLQRAKEVAGEIFKNLGGGRNRVVVQGAGELEPQLNNLRPDGRSVNRRVEVLLLKPVDE